MQINKSTILPVQWSGRNLLEITPKMYLQRHFIASSSKEYLSCTTYLYLLELGIWKHNTVWQSYYLPILLNCGIRNYWSIHWHCRKKFFLIATVVWFLLQPTTDCSCSRSITYNKNFPPSTNIFQKHVQN